VAGDPIDVDRPTNQSPGERCSNVLH